MLPDIVPAKNGKHEAKDKWYAVARRGILRFILNFKTLEGVGIVAAVAYACLTYQQWQDLRHNFRIQQRSWIKAVLDWSNFATANSVPVFVQNFGKDPGTNPRVIARMEILESQTPPSFVWKYRPHFDDQLSLLFPGDARPTFSASMLDDKYVSRKLTAEEVKSLNEGKTYVVVWGFITYTDSFGEHWTRVCDWKDFAKEHHDFFARPCVTWNSVGDGRSPDE